ncbi:TonB-dependent receptor [Candidatus Electronema sp. TJ]|uniref:TonB-dependent receptor n=1 Tax=Candidatus Electronema sp. TJ TaxID=3401573 RepID=UPI003AA888F7
MRIRTGVAAVMLLSGSAGAVAAELEKKESTSEQDSGLHQRTSIQLEDVVVRGEAVNSNLQSTSASVLSQEDIANRVYVTPLDMVAQAPGVSIQQYKQGGTAANFTMRGFSGNSHGPNTAIYVDGILLNEGDGYADTNVINPSEVERAEIIKGPSSALYGNYASAGTLAYYTKKRVDGQQVKLHYGAHNTYETNYVGGFSNEQTDYVFSLQNYHTDGYQAHSDWDKLNGAARISRKLNEDLRARISLRAFNSDWDAPGYLTKAKYEADPEQPVSETNGGSKDRLEGRLDFDYSLNSTSKALFYVWNSDQNFKRWYATDPDGLEPDAVVGNLRDFDRSVYGLGGSYNFIGELLGHELRLTAGTDYMVEDDSRRRWRLLAGTGREKGEQFWNYNIDMQSLGFFAEGSSQITPFLRLILGARFDSFSGELTDYLDSGNVFSMDTQNIFSPKAGSVLTLLGNRLELFANYSEGFALMPGFSEMAAFKQDNWDPQQRRQIEAGPRIRPNDWMNAELAAFHLTTSKDFIETVAGSGEFDNAGETTRSGIELRLDLYAFEHGSFHADYGFTNAEYDSWQTGDVSYAGKQLTGVPERTCNLEAGYSPGSGLGGRLRWHWEGEYYLDSLNTKEAEAWGRLDAQLSYRFGNKEKYLFALDIINLLDKEYADYVGISGTETVYSPALPLSAYLTMTVEF